MSLKYIINHKYKDTGSSKKDNDQFLKWLNIDGSGMLNSPGIRPLKFVNKDNGINLPAYLVLVTHEKKREGSYNPWDDMVDFSTGKIYYWGDSKNDPKRRYEDFQGNKCLKEIYENTLDRKYDIIPPILHFSKPEKGSVVFNGICVIDKLELTWFEDADTPVKNYRCILTILDSEEVEISWLHERANCKDRTLLNNNAPKVWKDYINGKVNKLNIWKKQLRNIDSQLPISGSEEDSILRQLVDLKPVEFEAVTVALFKQLPHITHTITRTQPSRDGGFDFYGHFKIPHPISYDIHFLGEVKKFSRTTAVQPKHVSRLVARLNRGQYGIFVTTSYYTSQTQQEVLEDGYPVKLFSGIDLVNFCKELNLVVKGVIRSEWLSRILDEI